MTETSSTSLLPEILAPAGSQEAFVVALSSGADVVYLGLSEGFNARARSNAFDVAGLPAVVAEAHRAGVKVYLTLNTLVFEHELSAVEGLLRRVIEAGVDALIIQDPAVALIAHALCPPLRLHASTQMTISSAEGARFAQTLGISRVVLPRELSVEEIARFNRDSPLESEVFIHGALCMAWSGQCLTSEALSGRSANRGQCSQACRMPYELVVDGEVRDLGDTRYLLSPQDLAGGDLLPELAAAGVHAVKIEGRYKNAGYVASAVDWLRQQRDVLSREASASDRLQLHRARQRTQLTFSRGGSLGFLGGDDHQALVVGKTPKHRGLRLGRVVEVQRRRVLIAAQDAGLDHELLRAGMGVMFEVGDPEAFDAPGGPVFGVQRRTRGQDEIVELSFGEPGPDLSRVSIGCDAWLTGDPEIHRDAERRAKQSARGRLPVTLRVSGTSGSALHVVAEAVFAQRPLRAEVQSEASLVPARGGAGLDVALLTDKLGAWGGTPFHLRALESEQLATGLYVPVSELKRMRRELTSQLEAQLTRSAWHIAAPTVGLDAVRAQVSAGVGPLDVAPRIVPLCRTHEQLDAAIASGMQPGDEVILDFMDLMGLSAAVKRAREAQLSVTLATVRVQKPGEEGYDRRIAALTPDAVLVRHWGGLMSFAEREESSSLRVHGDFSLNVTNAIAAQHVLGLGLDTVTASHDLDRVQLLSLLSAVPRGRVAVTLHHHIATFHNSHCVYAHLLSQGRDYRTCGRPCEQHRIALRDFAGHAHPVLVDIGCRNTMFNAQAQSAAPLLPALREHGVHRFIVELVWESAEETERTLRAYRRLLAGEVSASEALRTVGVHEQYGVTTLRR